MRLKENATAEKLSGSYYTPRDLADFIITWGFNDWEPKKILEPSCGDGAFIQCIAERISEDAELTAIEIDEVEAKKANALLKKDQVIVSDFYKIYKECLFSERFDLIIGNPPYIRYQYLTEEQRVEQSEILVKNGMKSNKLINSWVSFTVACIQMLSERGRIGFVIPAELLQVVYAEDLRKYLMDRLQRITIVTFKELVFDNIEQEVVILLGEKDPLHNKEHQIRILEYQNIEDLIHNYKKSQVEYQNIEANKSKWTRYFLTSYQNRLIEDIKKSDLFKKFDTIASVDVGITTGNNDFFCVNSSTIKEYGLDERIYDGMGNCIQHLRPLIARSVNIRGIKHTQEDMDYNLERGAKAYLLSYPNDMDKENYPEGHQKYILGGENNSENIGYKCQIRDQWYSIPSVWVPDAFFLRRNHLYPKFLLNTEICAVSTDTMHRVRFKQEINPFRAVLAYYNSVSLAFTEISARSYGGGVLEILPREVENIYVANIFNNDTLADKEVEDLVEYIDKMLRKSENIEVILDEIDSIVLNKKLGMNPALISEFRDIWKKLRDRRLARGKRI